ncbi:hypothetical protein [Streptomyces sp. 2A115]|uniref:hypothetical protein n=1 Tax=Streptomyces sp. 2A115 TaxID=3457439 RepID=UPI003FD6A76D
MSKRQLQKMFQLMASGEPVELTSPMSSVKKLSRLAFVAQQFGYEYADVRQGGGQGSQLKMLIVPDPGPVARQRAAQNWAQFPNAASGGPLPPFVPDALELLKARINFDLTGKNAEKRMLYGALGVTVGCLVLAVRTGGDSTAFVFSGIFWVLLMGLLGIGVVVTRNRNAKFAARLQAAGFAPVTDETGRVRYLPLGGQLPGHGNPFGMPAGNPFGTPAPGTYAPGTPTPGPYTASPGPYTSTPYAHGQYASQSPGPYGAQAPYPHPCPVPQHPHPQPHPQSQPHPHPHAYPQSQRAAHPSPQQQPRHPPHQ